LEQQHSSILWISVFGPNFPSAVIGDATLQITQSGRLKVADYLIGSVPDIHYGFTERALRQKYKA
jgi:hypothetical protein